MVIPAVLLALAPAALSAEAAPVPAVAVRSYRVVVRQTDASTEVRTVQSSDLVRVRTLDRLPPTLFRRGTEYILPGRATPGSALRNQHVAEPDGYARPYDRWTTLVDALIARARSGEATLTPVTVGARAALQGEVTVPENVCAATDERRVTVGLAARTLLPLLVVERDAFSGNVTGRATYAYTGLNGRFAPALFAPPRLGPGAFVSNNRFTRMSPRAAAGPLPYVPRVPTTLPSGYRLAVSGWAPRGNLLGPEGSIPRSPWMFGAVYRRGQEHIDVTMRVASTDWPDDPFGGECLPMEVEDVTVNGVPAKFGRSVLSTPHLYWREGRIRYTVRGPLPKADLIALAESLRRVTT